MAADDLAPDGVVVSDLPCGYGTVRCQHGLIPVPAPGHGVHRRSCRIDAFPGGRGRRARHPHGAAAAAALRTESGPSRALFHQGHRHGAGKRAYATPGILRAMIIEPVE